MWRRLIGVGALLTALLWLTGACSDNGGPNAAGTTPAAQASASSANASPSQELKLVIRGKCTSKTDTLTAEGSGFSPNRQYKTEAWYPDGKTYPGIRNPGT